MKATYLQTKINHLPNDLQKEVNSFVDFLMTKTKTKKRKAVFGCAKGEIKLSEDFDEPLDDFNEYI
jgi:hypothetical protein